MIFHSAEAGQTLIKTSYDILSADEIYTLKFKMKTTFSNGATYVSPNNSQSDNGEYLALYVGCSSGFNMTQIPDI
jgi:hypothetical protein